jgi:DnaJ-class molecular chaperone
MPQGAFQFLHTGGPGGIPMGFPGFPQMGSPFPEPEGKRGQPKDKEYYQLLNVSPSATNAEITKAFRTVSRQKHPDKGGDVDTFKKISSAYDILSNEEKRLCYDAYGKEFDSVPNIEIFKQQLRNADIQVVVQATLQECIKGKECKISYRRTSASGQPEHISHTFYLKPGTMHQEKFIFPNMGHVEKSKLPGNLIVTVHEIEQKDFKRCGQALLTQVKVDLFDLLLGKAIQIDHPRGETIHLHQPETYFQTETWYRIEGQGCTSSSPMFIQIKINMPDITLETRQKMIEVLGYKEKHMDNNMIKAQTVKPEDMQQELQDHEQVQHEAADQQQSNCQVQ